MENAVVIEKMDGNMTNQLLKMMLSKIKKANNWDNKKQKLVEYLKVDVEKVQPIDFTNQKYKKADHENNLFLFIDKDMLLVGILNGNEWKKEQTQDFENYYPYPQYNVGRVVIKNRKNMEEKAAFVLMLTPEMRTKSPKQRIRSNSKFTYKDDLKIRLTEYKKNKYERMPHDRVLSMVKEMVSGLNEVLFDDEKTKELLNRFRSVTGFYNDITYIVRSIVDAGVTYDKSYKEYHRVLEVFKKEAITESDFWIRSSKNDMDKAKLEIIKWYKLFIKDGE